MILLRWSATLLALAGIASALGGSLGYVARYLETAL
jgi:hypothetical protein